MAGVDMRSVIKDFSTYFGLVLDNITLAHESKIPVIKVKNKNEAIEGLRNIISGVSTSSNPELSLIQDQWTEYVLTNMENLDLPVLKEINEYMVDKVYFVGDNLGPVDILMYYLLHNIIGGLTFQEKEKFMHTCRWFNNVQQDGKARLGRSVIPFSRICLYT